MANWNEKTDPIDDKDYHNIREYVPSVDDPYFPDDSEETCCFSKTMEEVNPENG